MKARILTTMLALLVAAGAFAQNQSSFTITCSTSNNQTTFSVTRTSNTSSSETVYFRTVSLSAIAGIHFTDQTGTLKFDSTHNTRNVIVQETPSGNVPEQYQFQTGTTRSYRLELLDEGGFSLASLNHDIEYNSSYRYQTTYLNRTVTDLVYFKNGSIASGSGNKYLDVAHSGTANTYKTIDDGYDYNDNTLCTVNIGGLYNNNYAFRNYLSNCGNKVYATVYFTMKEEDDGYQYIQILADNSTTYDGKDGDGKISTGPTKSLYKACFELSKGTGSNLKTVTADHYQAFPHRYDYTTRSAGNQTASHTEFEYADSYLYEQAFKSSYRASTSGSLVLSPSVNNINVRFDANGKDDDTWYVKNLKVRLAIVDGTAPTVLNYYKVSGGRHSKGNPVSVSVSFNEVVTVTGTPYLDTTWGQLNYESGAGTNVLTFSGNIGDDSTLPLNVTGYSGDIWDLAGNKLSSTIRYNFGTTLDASYSYSITYNLDGGSVYTANPVSYTYETESFTLNRPTRDKQVFIGWTGSNGNVPQMNVTIDCHSHGNLSYTANWDEDYWGRADGADGSAEHPYIISSATDLVRLGNKVKAGNRYSFEHFQLANDIIISCETEWDDETSTEDNFTAIGTSQTNSFNGYFDGCGHTISGIRIYKPNNDYQGLFGYYSASAIRNLTLSNCRITGRNHVGAFAGYSSGSIENCTVSSNVCIHAKVSGSDSHGGVFGSLDSYSTIRNCISSAKLTAEVSSDCSNYGGIVGRGLGTIEDCFADGVRITTVMGNNRGAINGAMGTTLRNYYINCNINSTGSGSGISTGIGACMSDREGARSIHILTLDDNISASGEEVTYQSQHYFAAGCTVTLAYSNIPSGCTVNYSYNDGESHSLEEGVNIFTMPAKDVTVSASLQSSAFSGNGTQQDPFLIVSRNNLVFLASEINAGQSFYSGAFFSMEADINMSGINFDGIGNASHPFDGKIDGHGHVVTNLTINRPSADNVGFFGAVSADATVKNIVFSNASVSGNDHVGVLAGSYGSSASFTGNYYRSCTVNGETVNVGTGNGDVSGMRGLYTFGVPEGYSASGTTVTLGSTTYFAAGTTVTINSSYAYPVAELFWNYIGEDEWGYDAVMEQTVSGTTMTVPSADFSVYVRLLVPYRDADGTVKNAKAEAVTSGPISLKAGWCAVLNDMALDHYLGLLGEVKLILADGVTLSIGSQDNPLDYDCIGWLSSDSNLSVFGQSEGSGAMSLYSENYPAIGMGNSDAELAFYGGHITLSSKGYAGIRCAGEVLFRGGNVTVTGGINCCNLSLGWMRDSDSFLSDSYADVDNMYIVQGNTFTDGEHILDYLTSPDELKALGGITIRAVAPLANVTCREAENVAGKRYWGTFYDATSAANLPETACAYWYDSQHSMHRLGTDGRYIPAGCAVIILSSQPSVQINRATTALTNPSGNILRGTASAQSVPGAYVMSLVGGNFGFYPFTGTIPAGKAYYIH